MEIEEQRRYIFKVLNDMKIDDEDKFMSAVANVIYEYNKKIKSQQSELEKKDKMIDEIEEQLINENIKAKKDKEEIFRRDNIENKSINLIYSDRYMKKLGYELAIRKSVDIVENILKGEQKNE